MNDLVAQVETSLNKKLPISTGGIKNLINKKREDYWVLKHNKMPFPLWILFAKNVSKIPQLILRKRDRTLMTQIGTDF